MNEKSFFEKFYGVFTKAASYLNLAYLYLTFPLGIAYFVFLVTGWSLGIGLAIIWIGLLVLAMVFAVSWGLTAFERWLSAGLLRVQIPPMQKPADPSAKFWDKLKAWFSNPVTWKGMLYLLIKFPLGIFNFTVATTVLATSFSLLLAPLALIIPGWHVYAGDWNIHLELFNNQVFIARPDPYMIAGLGFLVGAFAAPASLHLLNWMAKWQGKLAQAMLGRKELLAGESAAPAVVEAAAEAVIVEKPEEVETAEEAESAPEVVDEETPEN